jgi:two-component system, sensor histidine kinase PdtaS
MVRIVKDRWPLWLHFTITGAAALAAHLLQIPLEREIPGEPFLLFFLVAVGATLVFGARAGFFATAMTTALSVFFFEPFGSILLVHASDLVKIEVYAILTTACVFAVGRFREALSTAIREIQVLKRAEEKKSLLASELAHGVANNFAAVAALMMMRSRSVKDPSALTILDDAIEQVRVMGRVHSRLRSGDREAWLDSAEFFGELCADLNASAARGRSVSIECHAESIALRMAQATSLGLIVNELVTNAIKHAFPDGRAGRIRISFEALKDKLTLCVEDDGVGFRPAMRKSAGMGSDLVAGLAHELGGQLEVASTTSGSSFRLSVPYASPASTTTSERPSATIH